MKKINLKNFFGFIVTNMIFAILANAQAPNFLWAKRIGGTGVDVGSAITVDASGNVYSTGYFSGTVDFNPGAGVFNLTSAGGLDIFISKLDASGNFVWAKAMGGADDDYGNSITLDSSGNVYSTGYFSGTVDFNPGAGTFNLLSAGSWDIFISKLDSAGNFVWAKQMGGAGFDVGNSIVLDASGNIYTTGAFSGIADFDPDTSTTFNLNAGPCFISKLDSSGSFVWAKAIGGAGGSSIAVDISGNVYTTGSFTGTADFDPGVGVYNLSSVVSGLFDIFVSKLDAAGNFIWAKVMGGASDNNSNSIAIDAAGNVYTTGYLSGTGDFDPGTGVFNLTTAGGEDIYISKLNASGNFVWAKQMGGPAADYGYSLAVDSSGNVYSTGYFKGTADFDPGLGTFNLTATALNGTYDIYISKLDSSGNFVWAKSAGGTSGDNGQSLALNALGNVYVTGFFASPSITFGSATITNGGGNDIFITKIDTSTITNNTNELENFDNDVLLFPNPAINHFTIALSNEINKNFEVSITDITGNIIYATTSAKKQQIEVNTKDYDNGIYIVKLQSADFIETKKLVIEK